MARIGTQTAMRRKVTDLGPVLDRKKEWRWNLTSTAESRNLHAAWWLDRICSGWAGSTQMTRLEADFRQVSSPNPLDSLTVKTFLFNSFFQVVSSKMAINLTWEDVLGSSLSPADIPLATPPIGLVPDFVHPHSEAFVTIIIVMICLTLMISSLTWMANGFVVTRAFRRDDCEFSTKNYTLYWMSNGYVYFGIGIIWGLSCPKRTLPYHLISFTPDQHYSAF